MADGELYGHPITQNEEPMSLVSEGLRGPEHNSYAAAITGKGGVRIIERYPSMSKISAIIRALARPSLPDKALR